MKNVQDIYPASPMQEVMLLHALTRRHNDSLLNQFVFSADATLDAAVFEAAWNSVIARHPMLRTVFVTQKVSSPLQVVREQVTAPFTVVDWREDDLDQRTARLETFCAEDRRQGIDVQRAPLMRFFLARWSDREWRFVWTSHHLLLDRWCLGDVFADLAQACALIENGEAAVLPSAPSFRQYIDWVSRQDSTQAMDYWRDQLRGFRFATTLENANTSTTSPAAATSLQLTEGSLNAIQSAARRFGVTRGTLVQAAVALLLCEKSGRDDVVFGTAAAARPPAVANVERIVGSFVNNLPVRVRLAPGRAVGDWLNALQRTAYERSDYEYLSPLQIARCADLPENQPLFDTLLVALAPMGNTLPLGLRALSSEMATAYPVTVSVSEDDGAMTLHVHLRSAKDIDAVQLLERLSAHLIALAACDSDALLESVLPIVTAPSATSTDSPITGDRTRSSRANPNIDPSAHAGREALSEALIRQLARQEFETALATTSFTDEDDFFALGGDSLRAAQMHARLCVATRKEVPLLALFRSPSVTGITRTLLAEDWPMTPGLLLPLRTGGFGAPLFCIASPEVNTLGYFALARRLSPQRNSYVLQSPPATGQPAPMHPRIIEPMARDYVDAMRDVQPTGPYHLLGMCGGSHLALAMTRILEQEGERVAFFGVINTWSLYSVSWVYYVHRTRRVLAYYWRRLRALLRSPSKTPAAPPRPSRPEAGPAQEDVGLNSPWIRDVGFVWRYPGAPQVNATAHVFRLKRQQNWRIRDKTLGWSRFFRDTKIIRVDGQDHDLLLREPHVAAIAQAIEARLCTPAAAHGDATPTLNPLTTGNV